MVLMKALDTETVYKIKSPHIRYIKQRNFLEE